MRGRALKAMGLGLLVPLLAGTAGAIAGVKGMALGAVAGAAAGAGSFLLIAMSVERVGKRRTAGAMGWLLMGKLAVIGAVLFVAMGIFGAHPLGVVAGVSALPASAAAFALLSWRRK